MPYLWGRTILINIRKDRDTGEWLVTQRDTNVEKRTLEERTYFGDEEEEAVQTALLEAERARQAGEEPFFTQGAIKRIHKYEPGYTNRGQF